MDPGNAYGVKRETVLETESSEMTMIAIVDVPRTPQARREPNLGRLEVELE